MSRTFSDPVADDVEHEFVLKPLHSGCHGTALQILRRAPHPAGDPDRVRVETAGAGERSARVDVPYLPRDVAHALHQRLAAGAAGTDFRW